MRKEQEWTNKAFHTFSSLETREGAEEMVAQLTWACRCVCETLLAHFSACLTLVHWYFMTTMEESGYVCIIAEPEADTWWRLHLSPLLSQFFTEVFHGPCGRWDSPAKSWRGSSAELYPYYVGLHSVHMERRVGSWGLVPACLFPEPYIYS